MAVACMLLFSHMACCQISNLSSRPSAGRGGVQRKPSPGRSAASGGECWALLPRVELMTVKLINGMSHLRQPAASLLQVCLPEVEESGNAQLQPALSRGSCLFRKQILRVYHYPHFQRAFETRLVLLCAFELQIVLMFFVVFAQSQELRTFVYIHVHTHAGSLHLLSNNFHILLILKGQQAFRQPAVG